MKISEYKTEAMKTVKSYLTDLDIDIEIMMKGDPCLFFLREHGSHSIQFNKFEGYPVKGEKAPYLFGNENRDFILKGKRCVLDHSIKEKQTNHILYFDGVSVKQVELHQARRLLEKYIASMKSQFDKYSGLTN